MEDEKRIVDITRGVASPTHYYTGLTSDVDARLEWHNHGPCGFTVDHRPWSLVLVMTFATEEHARRFER
jgi:predicted GIY-YIG superfamily endonuclease